MKLFRNLPAAVLQYLHDVEQKRHARKELILHAMDGVEEFYKEWDFYAPQIKECSIFMRELEESMLCLEEALREKAHEEVVFDCCFALFEALCSILREASLARGHRTEAEERLLTYFEKCGHWLSSDMTIVAEMYYMTLPDKYASH